MMNRMSVDHGGVGEEVTVGLILDRMDLRNN